VTRSPGRTTLLTSLALCLACTGAAPAMGLPAPVGTDGTDHSPSHHARTVHVRGQQVPVDADTFRYKMRGDLVGAWTMVPGPALHEMPTLYVESGTEYFLGCVDLDRNGRCGRHEPRGRLTSTYLYWASFDAKGALLRGQCVHPVTGGTKDFRGARGVIKMFDRPVGKDVRTTYRGHLVLHAVPSEPPAPAAPAARPPSTGVSSARPAGRHAC
jgi:hypothetical protein